MLVYFAVPGVALALIGLATAGGRPGPRSAGRVLRHLCWVLAGAALIVFAGWRYRVGTDYNLYAGIFRRLEPRYFDYYVENSAQEAGFTVFALMLKMVSDDPRLLFVVMSALTVGLVLWAISRSSASPAWSAFLYVGLGFYLAPFNIVRQGLAVSLNFVGNVGRLPRPLAIAAHIAAALIHASSVVVLAAQAILGKIRPTWWLLVGSCAGAFAVATSITLFMPLLELTGFLNERYTTYLGDAGSGIGTYLYLVSRLMLVVLVLWFRPKTGELDRYIMYSMASLWFLIVGTQVMVIARLELYFSVYLLVALPAVLVDLRREVGPAVKVGVIGVAVAFYIAYLSAFGNLLPYNFDGTWWL